MKITRRKDGRYQTSIELPRHLDGSRNRMQIIGKTENEVQLRYAEILIGKEKGGLIDKSRLKVDQFLTDWFTIHRKTLSPTTAYSYNHYINKHIVPAIGIIELRKLQPINIQSYYNNMIGKYKAKTIRQIHRIAHKAFGTAVKNNLLLRNPFDMVDIPQDDEYNVDVYTIDEFNTLLDRVNGTPDELVIVFAGICGLRRAEIFGLRWSDIDTKSRIIHIRQTAVIADRKVILKPPKNRTSYRSIAYPEAIDDIIKRHMGIGNKLIFSYNSKPINGASYSRHFNNMLVKVGVRHIRLHDLRHFNATLMLGLNINPKIAAGRLGHYNPTTLQRIYQHIDVKMDKEAADKIGNAVIKSSSNL